MFYNVILIPVVALQKNNKVQTNKGWNVEDGENPCISVCGMRGWVQLVIAQSDLLIRI